MKLHKPLSPVLIALALTFSLSACGDAEENSSKQSEQQSESSEQTQSAADDSAESPSEVADAETPKEAPPEAPPLQEDADAQQVQGPPEISLVPIGAGGQPPVDQQSEAAKEALNDPQAIQIGRTLFVSFNCVGCHFNGGGGMGPPLMDDVWIYGGSMENIASSIREGRPNGMPAFRSMVAGDTVYKLAAYVKSLSETADAEASGEDGDNSGKNSGGTEDRQPKDPG